MSNPYDALAAEEKRLTERLRSIREARSAMACGMTPLEMDLACCPSITRAIATPRALRRIADRMERRLRVEGVVSEDPAGYLSCGCTAAVSLIPDPVAQMFATQGDTRGWL